MPTYRFPAYLRVSAPDQSAAREAAAQLAAALGTEPELSLALGDSAPGVGEEPSPGPRAGSTPPAAQRYAMVVVVEAPGPAEAWETVAKRLGGERWDSLMPEVLYLGAPWEGVDAEGTDLATDGIAMAMTVPGELARVRLREHALRPCDPCEAGPPPGA